jgi:hypothetical protein
MWCNCPRSLCIYTHTLCYSLETNFWIDIGLHTFAWSCVVFMQHDPEKYMHVTGVVHSVHKYIVMYMCTHLHVTGPEDLRHLVRFELVGSIAMNHTVDHPHKILLFYSNTEKAIFQAHLVVVAYRTHTATPGCEAWCLLHLIVIDFPRITFLLACGSCRASVHRRLWQCHQGVGSSTSGKCSLSHPLL